MTECLLDTSDLRHFGPRKVKSQVSLVRSVQLPTEYMYWAECINLDFRYSVISRVLAATPNIAIGQYISIA